MYEPRSYRGVMGNDALLSFSLAIDETDIWVAVDSESMLRIGRGELTRAAGHIVRRLRGDLYRAAGERSPSSLFFESLQPLPGHPGDPPVVGEMIRAAEIAGTGPMAAVAGAFAEAVGRELVRLYGLCDVIVENGGDIWVSGSHDVRFPVYAGTSPLSGKIGLRVSSDQLPVGVCTSSGSVGHSLSFGRADALTVICSSAALADALATAACNRIRGEADVEKVVKELNGRNDVIGALGILGEHAAVCGNCEVITLNEQD